MIVKIATTVLVNNKMTLFHWRFSLNAGKPDELDQQ